MPRRNRQRPGASSGMIAGAGSGNAYNFHNQGVTRAEYDGPRGSGFTIEFLGAKATGKLDDALGLGVAVIRRSSIEAVVTTTDDTKQKMRAYLDGHFTGSAMHGNAHRRISNAAVQSVYFDDIKGEPGFASLIYSKFGFRSARGANGGGFVDFLLLHMRGGTINAPSGGWLRIPGRGQLPAQVGSFTMSDSQIYWVKSKDGKKLFKLRRGGGRARPVLLETLVKSLTIKPSLQGLEMIMAGHGAQFDRNFAASFTRHKAEAGL